MERSRISHSPRTIGLTTRPAPRTGLRTLVIVVAVAAIAAGSFTPPGTAVTVTPANFPSNNSASVFPVPSTVAALAVDGVGVASTEGLFAG